jgi:putative MFS transporter
MRRPQDSLSQVTDTAKESSPFCIPTALVASLGYFVDLYDLWLFSLYRVSIFADLQIQDSVQSGVWALSAQLTGLCVGGLLFGWAANRYGRRRTLLVSILVYSLGTLLVAGVESFGELVVLRFLTGLGLAGELGVAATLILEMVTPRHRWLASLGLILVGLWGSLAAVATTHFLQWRGAFLIGGAMGLVLLALRRHVRESPLFVPSSSGQLRVLWRTPGLRRRLLALCAIGLPITAIFWMVTSFSPELTADLGMHPPLSVPETLLWMQAGYIAGDILSIMLSHWWSSRRLIVGLSLCGCAVSLVGVCLLAGDDPSAFLLWSGALGVSAGFWGVLLSTCIEQFGTDLRGGASSIVPNLARASPLLLMGLLAFAAPQYGVVRTIFTLGILSVLAAFWGLSQLQESFGVDLDWQEGIEPTPEGHELLAASVPQRPDAAESESAS